MALTLAMFQGLEGCFDGVETAGPNEQSYSNQIYIHTATVHSQNLLQTIPLRAYSIALKAGGIMLTLAMFQGLVGSPGGVGTAGPNTHSYCWKEW
jgi:hypothetical protein